MDFPDFAFIRQNPGKLVFIHFNATKLGNILAHLAEFFGCFKHIHYHRKLVLKKNIFSMREKIHKYCKGNSGVVFIFDRNERG